MKALIIRVKGTKWLFDISFFSLGVRNPNSFLLIPQRPSYAGDCAVQKGGKLLLPINLLMESVSRGVCVCARARIVQMSTCISV